MKDYPLRSEEESHPLVEVCRCGHHDVSHMLNRDSSNKCKICICPRYEFVLKMHYTEYYHKIDFIDAKKQSDGFTA